jgi:ABC transporter substrate binding protein
VTCGTRQCHPLYKAQSERDRITAKPRRPRAQVSQPLPGEVSLQWWTKARPAYDHLPVSTVAELRTHWRLVIDEFDRDVLAANARLPAICTARSFADQGGLMSYGAGQAEAYRRAANAVGEISKGTKPSDIPYYRVSPF